MLSADRLAGYIESGSGLEGDGIAICPPPDLNELRASSATSVDLRLGRWFLTFQRTRATVFNFNAEQSGKIASRGIKKHFIPFGTEFILHPGSFVLAATLEWVQLPKNISGHITGKSSLGRHGIVIETASGVHPGFSGCLTLELANLGEIPFALKPGMKICQVFFFETDHVRSGKPSLFAGSRKPKLGMISGDKFLDDISSRL